MMGIKTDKKNLLISILTCLVLAVSALIVNMIFIVGAEGGIVVENGTNEILADEYSLNDKFTLPTDVSISDGSKNYKADVILRDPYNDGSKKSEVTLATVGLYTLEYRAKDDEGAPLVARQKFKCNGPLYNTSSIKSTATYDSNPKSYGTPSGIYADMSKNDTFYYNKPVNLNGKTKTDKLISFYTVPNKVYDYDCSRINFILTDQFNPDNKVTLSVKRVQLISAQDADHFSYVTANAVGQEETGLEKRRADASTIDYKGETYRLHKNNAYGSGARFSFAGGHKPLDNSSTYLGKSIHLTYDDAERAFYVIPANADLPVIIADLDDPQLFNSLWEGFSTDNVMISMSVEKISSFTAGVCITNIDGHDLTQTSYYENDKPVIDVDFESYAANNLPKAKVGAAYKIFDASAIDGSDGAIPVSESVWYNYSSPLTAARITLNDSKFVPPFAGTYTIVYSALDRSGNLSTRTVDIKAEALNSLSLTLNEDATATAVTGREYKVKTPVLSGGSGKIELKITATNKSDSSISYNIDTDTLKFVPLYQGDYTVKYEYKDYLTDQNKTYDVSFAAATSAYIAEEASINKYYIKGAKYKLNNIVGYTFVNGKPVSKACEIAVKQDDGNYETVDASGIITVTATSTVAVKYTLKDGSLTAYEKIYTAPVIADTGIDVEGELKMHKFFVNADGDEIDTQNKQDVAFVAHDNGVDATVANSAADKMAYGSFDFINPLLASEHGGRFTLSNKEFLKVSVFIADSRDLNKRIKLTFENSGSWKIVAHVNDGYRYTTKYNGESGIDYAFNAKTNSFKTSDTVNIPVDKFLDGSKFNGFESGFVYITYRIEGVYTTSGAVKTGGITLLQVNNHSVSSASNDFIPVETTRNNIEGDQEINSIVKISAVKAADVIDPLVSVYISVTDPDGNFVTDENGVVLNESADPNREYYVKLTKFGRYNLQIRAVTAIEGKQYNTTNAINVVDNIAPQIVFSEIPQSGEVGQKITLAKIALSDNKSPLEKIDYRVYIMNPQGKLTSIDKNSETFTPIEKGVYRVMYYVYDEVPNVCVDGYNITVA